MPPGKPRGFRTKPSTAIMSDGKQSLRHDFPRPLSRREQDFLHREMERELMKAPSLLSTSFPPTQLLPKLTAISYHSKLALSLEHAVKASDDDLDRVLKNVYDVVESLDSREHLSSPDPRLQGLLARVSNRVDKSSVDTLFYAAMLGYSIGRFNCDQIFEEILSVRRVYELRPLDLVKLFRARASRGMPTDREWQILASMVTSDIRLEALVPLLELLSHAKVEEPTSWEQALASLSWLTLAVPEFLATLSALKDCPDVNLAAKHCARAVNALDEGLVYELLSLSDRDTLLFTLAILKHRFESQVLCPHPLQIEVADGPARMLARRLASDMNLEQAAFPRMCRVSMALVQLGRLPDWTVKAIESRLASPRLLLLPSAGVQPTDLLSLLWALHRWPNAWRRRPEWGAPNGLGAQLHMALRAHLTAGTMTARMLLTAVECLASITTRRTKPVLLDAMREAARLALEEGADLTVNEVCMAATTYTVRLQLAAIEPQTAVGFLQLVHQAGLDKLTTPQLADLCEVHSHSRIITGLPETLDRLAKRLENTGGLIAPAVAARVLVSGAKMQIAAPEGLILALAKAVSATDTLHPRVGARSLWGIIAWLAGRKGEPGLPDEVEKLALAVATRESMETVLEHRGVSGMLWQALSLPQTDPVIREALEGYRHHLLALDQIDEYKLIQSGRVDIDGLLEQAGLGRSEELIAGEDRRPQLPTGSGKPNPDQGSIERLHEFKFDLALPDVPTVGEGSLPGIVDDDDGDLPETLNDMRHILGETSWRELVQLDDEGMPPSKGIQSASEHRLPELTEEDLDSPKDASYLAGLRAAALKRTPRAAFPKLQGLMADILSALKVCQKLPRLENELDHEWHKDSGGFEYAPRLHEQFDLDWLHKGANIGIRVLGPKSFALDDQRHLLCDAKMAALQFEGQGIHVIIVHSDDLSAAYKAGESELKKRVRRANRLPETSDSCATLRRNINIVLGVEEGFAEHSVCLHES
ncbi:hypothetical protein FOL47_011205 [Perkinsus chesapeaki]|uniref:RAP domain-containing protein n=1 Tax=Perkinsus chesapeaki TaxID=330153 RepID=A0A7J6MNK6_PERCH|nr:hypothetical protein FOL47_011205 [Perkinsus chesapeaki]